MLSIEYAFKLIDGMKAATRLSDATGFTARQRCG
jgi:hypothetical protein